MRSITVHGIDTELDQRLTRNARELGLSLNKTIKGILAAYLGVNRNKVDHSSDFNEFCGAWSKSDKAQFAKRTKSLEQVDKGDWE